MRRRLVFLGFTAALVAANLAAFRLDAVADLTPNRRFTLQPESVRVARRLPARVTVTVFLSPQSRTGREAKLLLERYARVARGLRYAFVDPRRNQARLQAEGVVGGQAIIAAGGRRIVAEDTSEQKLTSSFLRLLRPVPKTVCFTSGHGERDPTDDSAVGVSAWAAGLDAAGYQVVVMPPGALAGKARPPCDVVVVAGPQAPFTPPEAEGFQRYLQAEGKAFVLADPPGGRVAGELVAPWGVRVLDGVVVDPAQNLGGDPLTPLVDRYPSFSPVVDSVAPGRVATVWPEVGGLERPSGQVGPGGLYVSTIAETSRTSWLEVGGGQGFQRGVDRPGPVVVAAAADASRVGGRERRVPSHRPRVIRTRLLVFADVDLASNAVVAEGPGNGRLLMDAVAWLAADEEIIGLVPKPVAPVPLVLSARRLRALTWWAVVFPAAEALVVALSVWWLRRA